MEADLRIEDVAPLPARMALGGIGGGDVGILADLVKDRML